MHRLVRTLVVLVGSLGVLVGPASVGSGAVSKLAVRQLPPVVHSVSGGKSTILVRVRTSPAATCRATVSVKRVRQALSSVTADKRGRVGWRWLILPTSPSGTWRITTGCHSGHKSGKASRSVFVVTVSKKATGSVGDPTSLSTTEGTTAGYGAGACGPFTPGQTCLTYRKRKDVYDTAVAHGVPRGGTRAAGRDFFVWDGGQWLVNAQRAGIPTGSHPVAGALVVWGVPNSATYGHVAYVVRATSDTHVLVTECGFDWKGGCRTIWENPRAAAHLQGYIYGGPAGSGTPISIQGTAAPVNTAPPTTGGTPAVGSTLTATNGGWTGSGTITYTYQWQNSAGGSTGWASATGAGATASSYTIAAADAGGYLRVVVTASNAGGSTSAVSAATAVASAPVNTSLPVISGTAQSGQALSASPGAWSGTQPISYTYQWRRCDTGGGACGSTGATGSSYTLTSGDVGSTIRVAVTATNSVGSTSATSAATAVVQAGPTQASPVALWHMDETSDSVMIDATGRSHTGTLSNVQTGLSGSLNFAYGFNGSNSSVSVPSALDLNPGTANITITIHLKTTTAPKSPDWDLIRKGYYATSPGEFKMEYQPSGQASCGFKGSAGYSELMAGPALNNDAWHEVKCVKTTSSIAVVVDGTSYSQAASIGSITNTDPVVIGAYPGAEFFQGSLDEASIAIG